MTPRGFTLRRCRSLCSTCIDDRIVMTPIIIYGEWADEWTNIATQRVRKTMKAPMTALN